MTYTREVEKKRSKDCIENQNAEDHDTRRTPASENR